MEDGVTSDPERRSGGNGSVLKVMVVLIAVLLAICVGAAMGGALVYGSTKVGDLFPSAAAQSVDSESGILVASVVAGSPAEAAGIVRGDILLAFAGEPIGSAGELARRLEDYGSGDQVELTVRHGDEQRKLTTDLDSKDGRAYLGIVPCGGLAWDGELEVHLDSAGVIIVEVLPESPAEEAGLREGDIIVSVEGQSLGAEKGLADLIGEYKPGDAVTIEIERPGEGDRKVVVELAHHPENEAAGYLGVRYSAMDRPEIRRVLPFGDLGGLEEGQFALPGTELKQGAIILSIVEDGPASAAGLEEGDLITGLDGTPITGPDGVVEAIAQREPGDRVTLAVQRPGGEETLEINVTLGQHPEEEEKAFLGVTVSGASQMQFFEGREWLPGKEFHLEPLERGTPWEGLPFDPDLHFGPGAEPFDWEQLPFDPGRLPFEWEDLRDLILPDVSA